MSPSATTLSQVESSTAFPPDDIGGLLNANQKLNDLDPTRKYQLLTSEPNRDPSYYPKTYCAVSKQYRHFLETSTWFTAFFIWFQVRLLLNLMMTFQKHSVKLLIISKTTCLITTCFPLSIECGPEMEVFS